MARNRMDIDSKKLLMERHNAAMKVVKQTAGLEARVDLLLAVVAPSPEMVKAQIERRRAADRLPARTAPQRIVGVGSSA